MSINSSTKWFTYVRSSYLPANTKGLVIYFIYMAYLIALIVDWYFKGHQVWNFLVDVVPYSVGAAAITQFVASKHAK